MGKLRRITMNAEMQFDCVGVEPAKVLKVTMSGRISTHQKLAHYQEIIEQAEQEQTRLLLVDNTELVIDGAAIDIHHMMDLLRVKLKSYQVARVIIDDGHQQQLIQQCADYNNLKLQHFLNEHDAIYWLSDFQKN